VRSEARSAGCVPRRRVAGGGFIFLGLVNTFGTARRVADALRRSPEFRSL
jgi:hypothetical protein